MPKATAREGEITKAGNEPDLSFYFTLLSAI